MANTNQRTALQLARLAQQYGPQILAQLQGVLEERQHTAHRAAGGTTVPSEVRNSTAPPSGSAGRRRAARPGIAANAALAAAGLLAGPAQQALDSAGRMVQSRSPEARLNRKLDVLTELVDDAQPGTAFHARAEAVRPRLEALAQKRDLVLRVWTGRQRAQGLRELHAAADEMVAEFLAAADETMG